MVAPFPQPNEFVYDEYRGTVWTDEHGVTSINLVSGEYRFVAKYENYKLEDKFLHTSFEEIRIDLEKGESTIKRPKLRPLILGTVCAFIILGIAVYGITKIPKR